MISETALPWNVRLRRYEQPARAATDSRSNIEILSIIDWLSAAADCVSAWTLPNSASSVVSEVYNDQGRQKQKLQAPIPRQNLKSAV